MIDPAMEIEEPEPEIEKAWMDKLLSWPRARDVTLFIAGLLGVAHETLLAQAERPTLLILFAAMLGLPAFLQKSPEGK